jgi:hypothetical protein
VSTRRTRLVECNPRWGVDGIRGDHQSRWLTFECPEGHANCRHQIPFTPSLDGANHASPQRNGAIWTRTGDTFETLTLTPSIRRDPIFPDARSALDGGYHQDDLPSLLCAFHGHIKDGGIEFCGDSR